MKRKSAKTTPTRAPVRQGDVLLLPRAEVPDGLEDKPQPSDGQPGLFLQAGESSGHTHRLFGGAKLYHFRDTNNAARVLVVESDGAELRVVGGESAPGYARHTPVQLAPGAWEVRVQRQYTAEDERRHRAVED